MRRVGGKRGGRGERRRARRAVGWARRVAGGRCRGWRACQPSAAARVRAHRAAREGRGRGGYGACLLYASDAADEMQCVDLGGR
eukprot:6739325-Prymnesium_polylepis.1